MYNNNTKYHETKKKGEENNKYNIDIEPIDFESTVGSKRTTTVALATQINQVFRPFLWDFHGSKILPINNKRFSLTLAFIENGPVNSSSSAVKVLEPLNVFRANDDPLDQFKEFSNNITRSKSFKLTNEAKEILSDFMIRDKDGKIHWEECLEEQSGAIYNGRPTIYVYLKNLNLFKVFNKLYKKGKDNNTRVSYDTVLIRPLTPPQQNYKHASDVRRNFLIDILQVDNNEVKRLSEEAGMIPQGPGEFVITA